MPNLRQTNPKNSEEVGRELLARINSGDWQPGERLPAERDLAREYGLARNTIRRALRSLEARGMIVRFVGRGTFVSGGSSAGLHALMTRLETASPTDVMEVRIIIEPHAAALAAHRANSEDLRALDEILRNSISAKGIAEFEHWDAQLHLAIFRAAKNALLLDYCQAINSVRNQPHWYRLKQKSLNDALRITYNTQHSKIVTALKERDGDTAKRALYAHLITVRDRMLQTGL